MSTRTIAHFRPTVHNTRNASVLARLLGWMAIYRQRRHLQALPDHLLEDIGLTRYAAETEAKKRLWDAPAHWQH